jgi:hypothetical protein
MEFTLATSLRRVCASFLSTQPEELSRESIVFSMALASHEELYQYSSLPKGVFIRVLLLKSGELGSALEVSLQTVSLDEQPSYVALSYTWGHPDDSTFVRCEGKLIKVPSNLYHALHSLRDRTCATTLWADSISIDQTSNQEKNHQVPLMGRIYQQASSVVAWLGADKTRNAHVAFDLARQVARHQHPLMPRNLASIPSRAAIANDLDWYAMVNHADANVLETLDPEEISRWEALAEIYRRAWFTRMWVIQEVGMASCAVMKCGDAEIAWAELKDAAGCIDDRANMLAAHFAMGLEVQRCFDLHWLFSDTGSKQTFVETLYEAKSFLASNPKDKVYALLAHPSARLPNGATVKLDYDCPLPEWYTALAATILTSTHSLQLLSAVQHSTEAFVLRTDLPSWVPQWAEQPTSNMLWHTVRDKTYRTGLETLPEYDLALDKNLLKVKGVLFDRVEDCGHTIASEDYNSQRDTSPSPSQMIAKLLKAGGARSAAIYSSEEAWIKAHYMTLTAGMFMGGQDDFRADEAQQQTPSPFRKTAQLWSNHRKPFLTAKGYVGLGPSFAKEHDIVVVLFGCMMPFVLRPHGNEYKLVGEAYVHGIMKGEAIQMWRREELHSQNFCLA